MKFDVSEGFRERGETDEATKKLKPNMAIEHGVTGIHRLKKKGMHRLTYKVKSGTDIGVSWEQKQWMMSLRLARNCCSESFWAKA